MNNSSDYVVCEILTLLLYKKRIIHIYLCFEPCLFTVAALESVDVAGSFVQLEVGFKGERRTTLFASK